MIRQFLAIIKKCAIRYNKYLHTKMKLKINCYDILFY